MEFRVYDKTYKQVAMIDSYRSAIWTERYDAMWDLELQIPMPNPYREFLENDNYLSLDGTNEMMTIERTELTSDIDDGDYWTVKAHNQSNILRRRVIFPQTVIKGDFQTGVSILLRKNIISPPDTSRAVPNFTFLASTDPRIEALEVNDQYTGDGLYDSIQKLCMDRGVGFAVKTPSPGVRQFSLFMGEDRSYGQTKNPYVVMSPEYDSMTSSRYVQDIVGHATTAYIGGEGEGPSRIWIVSGATTLSGVDRKEVYVDAKNVSTKNLAGTTLHPDEYRRQLTSRGSIELAARQELRAFDAEVLSVGPFKYGVDFYLGDIIQIKNEYGMTGPVKITEYIRSMTEGVYSEYPTFVAV